jgi:lipopolysaccharide transport system ATP-binding protein
MSDPAIIVENVRKRYLIGYQRPKSDGIRNVVEDAIRKPLKWLREAGVSAKQSKQEFWALNGISFNVPKGDIVGIIGRNGAGKSTLLKVLSRITEPTSGRIELDGRVASLLEVGTGFHPELTGRENIFLNGAILGMGRAEIHKKFDEIVEFSEIAQFLDTPVKRYSSGMYVRLAFAVAAHLEPEILIVDEVLAVGDAQFQQKCLGKMGEVAKEGVRTVLFVSHQMAAIANLCRSCVVLSKGTVAYHGPTENAIRRYLDASTATTHDSNMMEYRASWAKPYITSASILNADGSAQQTFPLGSDFIIEIAYNASELPRLKRPVMGVVLKHSVFGPAAAVNMRMTGSVVERDAASGTIRCRLPAVPFVQGNYSVDLWLGDGMTDVDMLEGYLNFSIEATDIYGTGQPPFANMGLIYLQPQWSIA